MFTAAPDLQTKPSHADKYEPIQVTHEHSADTSGEIKILQHHRRRLKHTIAYIGLYYVFAVVVALFNKKVIGGKMVYPLMLSGCSAIIQSLLALGCLVMLGCLRKTINKLTLKQYLTAIVPCAVASGLDIGISNSSLQYVSLSFYTMVKSSAPIFVLACALILGLERPSCRLFLVMGVIAGGTLMTVWSDGGWRRFDVHGFGMVLSAAMLSGVRWSLTQLIIEEHNQDEHARLKLTSAGPLATILYLAPIAGVLMLTMGGLVEGFRNFYIFLLDNFMYTLTVFTLSGTLTFALILTEYKVVQETSVLTFAITGIFKEIVLIALSMIVFGDRLILVNYVGIVISIGGIAGYNWLRWRMREESRAQLETANKLSIIPPAEPLQSFFTEKEEEDRDDGEMSEGTEELYISKLIGDNVDGLDGKSTLEQMKARLSIYLSPFGPQSSESLIPT